MPGEIFVTLPKLPGLMGNEIFFFLLQTKDGDEIKTLSRCKADSLE